jgi:hypothetical protein
MYKKVLILAVFLMVLSGCKKDTEIVTAYKITDQISETISGITEQGLYEITDSKMQFVIYHGVEKGIHTMSYSVEDNILIIHYETEEINQTQDYVYKINTSSSFDTIKVIIDGKMEAFMNVFVGL